MVLVMFLKYLLENINNGFLHAFLCVGLCVFPPALVKKIKEISKVYFRVSTDQHVVCLLFQTALKVEL